MMAVFKDAIEVSIPDFSLEELSEIVKHHDTDEIMMALGYERKINGLSFDVTAEPLKHDDFITFKTNEDHYKSQTPVRNIREAA